MPKKMKFDLEELKVQSFITSLYDDEKQTLIGGRKKTKRANCSNLAICDFTKGKCDTAFPFCDDTIKL